MIKLFKKICKHENVNQYAQEAYCPDCGELIQNSWYVVRCSCCGVKRFCHVRFGKILPNARFCNNCGSSAYNIEKIEKITFINLKYAVHIKEAISQPIIGINQVWVENSFCPNLRLIGMKNAY